MTYQLLTVLDNRELALVCWLAVVLTGLILSDRFRPTLTGIVRAMHILDFIRPQ